MTYQSSRALRVSPAPLQTLNHTGDHTRVPVSNRTSKAESKEEENQKQNSEEKEEESLRKKTERSTCKISSNSPCATESHTRTQNPEVCQAKTIPEHKTLKSARPTQHNAAQSTPPSWNRSYYRKSLFHHSNSNTREQSLTSFPTGHLATKQLHDHRLSGRLSSHPLQGTGRERYHHVCTCLINGSHAHLPSGGASQPQLRGASHEPCAAFHVTVIAPAVGLSQVGQRAPLRPRGQVLWPQHWQLSVCPGSLLLPQRCGCLQRRAYNDLRMMIP